MNRPGVDVPAPTFSIVIPVYNRAATILPALQSVRRQTFRNFECIVVDDGSKDSEALKAVVDGLGDARFRYVRRPNGGASAARNTGIDEARGEYVAFLDSDDEWLPFKLDADSRLLAPSRVIFSQVIVARGGRHVGRRPSRGPLEGEDIAEYLACHQGFTQPSTMVLHRDLARRVKFDPAIGFLGIDDTDLAIRLAAAGAEFHMHPDPSAIMYDDETGDRLSRKVDWRSTQNWLDGIRSMISERAYLSYRGWHVARQAAQSGELGRALRFYFTGFRAFPMKLKAKALIQILVPRRIYKAF